MPVWEEIERRISEAASWRPALDACLEAAGVQLERPKLEAGEPWCTVQLAGLQFYRYDAPGLDDAPLRPDAPRDRPSPIPPLRGRIAAR